MSDSTQSRNPGRITTPEEYWEQLMEDKRERKEAEAHLRALFAETDRQMKESIKETDRRIQETDRLLQETLLGMKETDKRMKETDRLVGRLGNRFGELAEHLVVPNLKEKFNALGYRFDYTSTNVEVAVEGRLVAEIDVLLENGEYALAVEIKSKPVLKDIEEHIKRMEILRRYPHRFRDGRVKLLGALAGAIVTEPVRDHIIKNGFFLLEQSGDTMLVNVPEGFKPREW